MRVSTLLTWAGIAASAVVLAESGGNFRRQGKGKGKGKGHHNERCVDPDLIQANSTLTGLEPGTPGALPGRVPSAT